MAVDQIDAALVIGLVAEERKRREVLPNSFENSIRADASTA